MKWSAIINGAVAMTTVTALAADAQTSPVAPSPAAPFTAGWDEGFVLQSANGDNRIVLGLTAQTDGRFSLDDPSVVTNTFTIRKARPGLSGRVAKYFDFKLTPDFGSGNAVLLDAYFDVRFSPKIRVRSGKDKTPVGYELLQGDPYLLFPERSLASSLVPNRDVGFQVLGEISPRFCTPPGSSTASPMARARQPTSTQQLEGSRRPRRVAALPILDDAARSAEQSRIPDWRVGGQPGRHAAVVQNVGGTDLLLVRGRHVCGR